MTINHSLTDAFAALERDAPDAASTFAALSERLDDLPRQRTRRTATASLTATAAVAAVAALAVGASLLPGGRSHDAEAGTHGASSGVRHIGGSATATSALPRVRQVAFGKNIATTTGADGIERPLVTVDAGWLPDKASVADVSADTTSDTGGSERRWLVPYPHGGLGGYYVSIQRTNDTTLPDREFGATTGQDITVQGRPARLFDVRWGAAVHQVIIAVDFGQGRIYQAAVFFETAKLTSATALDITEHVAQTMKVDQRDVLRVTARLTEAPADARIVDAYAVFDDTVYSDHFTMTAYRLDDEDTGAQIGIGGLAEKYPASVKDGTPGRPVQGRPSVVLKDKGHVELYIKGLFGDYTKLISGKGAETLDDLYQIADGIRAAG